MGILMKAKRYTMRAEGLVNCRAVKWDLAAISRFQMRPTRLWPVDRDNIPLDKFIYDFAVSRAVPMNPHIGEGAALPVYEWSLLGHRQEMEI
jgi:hypothetical protein